MSGSTQQLAPDSRSRRIDTRFSNAELALVEKVAGWRGLPPSAFVRGAALAAAKRLEGHGPDEEGGTSFGPSSLTADQVLVVDAARVDVKRVGVNLNQLTRLSHLGVVDLGMLAPVVEQLAEHCERLVDALGGRGSR